MATGAVNQPEPGAGLERAVAGHYAGRRRLAIVALVAMGVMVVQIAAGLWAGSLVLLADAFHYFGDLGALMLALAAASIAARPPSAFKTFGYHRAEVVAAFVNALLLWLLGAFLLWEAYQRIRAPTEVDGLIVAVVGAATAVLDIGLARYLHADSRGNLNVRAAYVHVLSDALGSVAAVVAGLAVFFFGLHVADPVATIFVVAMIFLFAWRLSRQTFHILMEGTPKHLDLDEVASALRRIPGIQGIHDLHIWTLTPGVESLSVHVVLDEAPRGDEVTHAIHRHLKERFGLDHATVQVEDPECPCEGASHGVATTPT